MTNFEVCKHSNIFLITPHSFFLASSATKELDDLMASLSDFKVSAAVNTDPPKPDPVRLADDLPPPTPVSPTHHSSMQSKTDDYAKVDKPAVKPKRKFLIFRFNIDH